MKSFSFMRFRWLFFAISLAVLIPGFVSLALFGLKPSIDFTGGSLLEIRYQTENATLHPEREAVQGVIGEQPEIVSVQQSGNQQMLLRARQLTNQQKDEVIAKLKEKDPSVTELRFETVGPVLGRELLQKAIVAIVIVAIGIMLYVWRQFKSPKYGFSAIFAMFHDTFVLLGVFSILGKLYGTEVDVLFVTALLTTLSFSIHDTIVVFDRIRENRKKHPSVDFETVVDASILETLSRSINNSMTIIIMLLSLVLLGGETIRWFTVALLVGAVTGTYSSTFTAAPVLVSWDEFEAKWRQRKTKKA
jgi:preprotein translocase subunit SecF